MGHPVTFKINFRTSSIHKFCFQNARRFADEISWAMEDMKDLFKSEGVTSSSPADQNATTRERCKSD